MAGNNRLKDKDPVILVYEDTDYDNTPVRIYDSGQVYQSASFLDPDKKYELVFEYMRQFDRTFELNPAIQEVLLIGGAAYAYPKYIISHKPGVHIDVVEIDPMAIETARQFFFLNDLFEEFGSGSFSNIIDDGRHYLENSDKKYDLIINDAFVDVEPVFELLSIEALGSVKSGLNEKGIYLLNLPGYRKLEKTLYIKDVLKTLKCCFRYVLIFRAFNYRYLRSGNYVVMASDNCPEMPDMLDLDLSEGMTITDENIPEIRERFIPFIDH